MGVFMKKEQSQLRSGVVLSYVNLALSCIIPFLYTPIMLRMLGEAEYGLYSLSSSVIGYLSILSFGFGSTILRYMSMYRAKREKENEEKVFGFFLLLYGAVALLIMLGGVVIANNVETIFHRGLTDAEIEKMHTLVLIMSFSSAISFPISVFSSVVMAHERYVFRKLIDMLSTVIVPISNLVVLYLGFASVGMAMVSVVIQFLMLPINMYYCFKVLNVRPKFAVLPKSLIQEMVGFSAFVFLGTVVDMLFWSTDKVLLGMLASSTAVAVYNIGATFNSMVLNLSSSISNVLTPRITAMVSTEAAENQLTEIFVRVGRIQYIIVALVVSGFAVFGKAFIRLWAGEAFSDSYWIALVTMIPLGIPLIQSTGIGIVTAQNKHKFRSIVYLIIAVVNVVATYFAIPHLGGFGAAICSGVSYIVGQGFCMNLYYWKVTGIDIPLFWKNILKMSIVPVLMLISGLLLNQVLVWKNWGIFFCGVVVYTLIYALLMYIIALNAYEKDLFKGIVRKVLPKR